MGLVSSMRRGLNTAGLLVQATFLLFAVTLPVTKAAAAAMQAQSLASDDGESGAASSSSSSQGWESNIISAITLSETPLLDSPTPVERSSDSSSTARLVPAAIVVAKRPVPQYGKFDLKAAFWQSFSENLFYHAWRVSTDPGMRWNLAHK